MNCKRYVILWLSDFLKVNGPNWSNKTLWNYHSAAFCGIKRKKLPPFTRLPHEEPLTYYKAWNYGLSVLFCFFIEPRGFESILTWATILDFLTNRTQRVPIQTRHKGVCSQPCTFEKFNHINICGWHRDCQFDGRVINHVVKWCEDSDLQLNVSETNDMIIDFRKHAGTPENTTVMGQTAELVQPHKCRDCYWKFTEF